MRNAVVALLALAVGSTTASAQSWADKMFKDGTTHDFGNVPRGAQLFHRFSLTNIYAVPLQILDVRTSCSCATVTPSTRVLQPREKGYIDVSMDGKRFTGQKNIRVNITVGPEFTSTAELRLSATSRADVVFNPGQVNFGVVNAGEAPTQAVEVEYAGTLPWQIQAVAPNGAPVTATLQELYRRPGQVGYRVNFTLKADAPSGPFKHEVLLQTNDRGSPMVPVLIEGTVQGSLTVTPSPLKFGAVAVGQDTTRRVIVRGNKPFRILGVDGLGGDVSTVTALPSTPAAVHSLTFKCKMPAAGETRRVLQIKTDLQDKPLPLMVEVSAVP